MSANDDTIRGAKTMRSIIMTVVLVAAGASSLPPQIYTALSPKDYGVPAEHPQGIPAGYERMPSICKESLPSIPQTVTEDREFNFTKTTYPPTNGDSSPQSPVTGPVGVSHTITVVVDPTQLPVIVKIVAKGSAPANPISTPPVAQPVPAGPQGPSTVPAPPSAGGAPPGTPSPSSPPVGSLKPPVSPNPPVRWTGPVPPIPPNPYGRK